MSKIIPGIRKSPNPTDVKILMRVTKIAGFQMFFLCSFLRRIHTVEKKECPSGFFIIARGDALIPIKIAMEKIETRIPASTEPIPMIRWAPVLLNRLAIIVKIPVKIIKTADEQAEINNPATKDSQKRVQAFPLVQEISQAFLRRSDIVISSIMIVIDK